MSIEKVKSKEGKDEKLYSVINKHSLNLDEIFNLSRKGTRAKIRWS